MATVTAEPRLKMNWQGHCIVDLARSFLNSNGAEKHTDIHIPAQSVKPVHNYTSTGANWQKHLGDLNLCSQRGLVERFDSTIGAGTVLMPYGGDRQATPTQAMVAKIPVLHGETDTCSVMGWGYNPYLSEQSPFLGAMYAVVESVAKVVSVGGSRKQCWLTFQEYFERTQNDPTRWGQPMAALLGAYEAQIKLGIASIGGKDSMSGTFEDISVPPTLVSFAVSMADTNQVIGQGMEQIGDQVALILPKYQENGQPDFEDVLRVLDQVEEWIKQGSVRTAFALTSGGVSEALFKMCAGNAMGVKLDKSSDPTLLFNPVYGGFVLELAPHLTELPGADVIGTVISKYTIIAPEFKLLMLHLNNVEKNYEQKLERYIRSRSKRLLAGSTPSAIKVDQSTRPSPAIKVYKPGY